MNDVQEKSPKAAPHPNGKTPPSDPRPEIDPSLLHEVGLFLDDPEAWFRTPNTEFELRAPIELLGTPEEARLRNRIEAAKHGMFS